jgi:hypothetical protein
MGIVGKGCRHDEHDRSLRRTMPGRTGLSWRSAPDMLPFTATRVMPRYALIYDTMQTYIYYVAEKVAGALEMQRFAHPIHVGLVTAENHVEAYTSVLENLRPTFADEPQPLEVRFEVVMPPRAGEGVWRHGKPIDTDITFGDED